MDLINDDGRLYADSRMVARGWGIEHKSLRATIERHAGYLGDLRSLNLSESGTGGRPSKVYWLTKRQVMLLPAIIRSTEQSRTFQRRIVDIFEAMERKLRSAPPPVPFNTEPSGANIIAWGKAMIAELEEAHVTIGKLKPKADFAERVFGINSDVLISTAGKTLSPHCDTGPSKIFLQLREWGAIFKREGVWVAKQELIRKGYFAVHLRPITKGDGTEAVVPETRITPRGVQWVYSRLGGDQTEMGL